MKARHTVSLLALSLATAPALAQTAPGNAAPQAAAADQVQQPGKCDRPPLSGPLCLLV